MTPFEEELKKALRRQEPADGFTERVLTQVATPRHGPRGWLMWQLTAAAAATLVLAGGMAYQQYEHREYEHQVQGETAKRKLLLALRIAGSKLQEAQQHVNQVETQEETQ